jgi:hypothetical protein
MRYDIQSVLTTINDVIVYDPTSVNWNEFVFTNGFFEHMITKAEILKPYLISYSYYGNTDYIDLILLINNVENIFEIPPGSIIKIPKREDLEKFILDKKL